ncbi:hypothetical protein DmAi_17330 [Acetobacter persici]|uniref:Uncharacterized protein n=1 Tax=Acetobacter persici TaxID=1076596 RepID=A0A6V8I8N8_9PROT|nr:hypothetical protein DmAi_17330 [Acetobacter persici]
MEAFDKAVLLRFHWGNIVPFDLHISGPFQDGMGCELCSVIADNHEGFAIAFHQGRQFPRYTSP